MRAINRDCQGERGQCAVIYTSVKSLKVYSVHRQLKNVRDFYEILMNRFKLALSIFSAFYFADQDLA